MDTIELGLGVAVAGASIVGIHSIYTQHAGTLNAARTSSPGDAGTDERLHDADLLTGALVVLLGGGLAIATGKPHALLLAVGAFAIVALYYHSVSGQPSATPTTTTADTSPFADRDTQSDFTPTDSGALDYTYDGTG